jgi:diaminopimelate epimerase
VIPVSRRFYKMSGSGNDFIVFDALRDDGGNVSELERPEVIRELCARGTGVGADGIVILTPEKGADFRMTYYNSDGSRASMCGNAGLCVTALAVRLGAGRSDGMRFESDAGAVVARVRDGLPEIELDPVRDIRPDAGIELGAGEERIGYAVAGVPHLIVLRADVAGVDVVRRGRALRWDRRLAEGANVNFLSPGQDGWDVRTYERGVEGETLACGTGAVAAAVVLEAWGSSGPETRLRTRSGRVLTVRLRRQDGHWLPSLSGEGQLVFTGELGS